MYFLLIIIQSTKKLNDKKAWHNFATGFLRARERSSPDLAEAHPDWVGSGRRRIPVDREAIKQASLANDVILYR